MSCQPIEILAFAESLSREDGAGEAQLRSAVSRSYYAALHAVNIIFPKQEDDVRVDGESSHAEIIGRAKRYSSSLLPGRTNAASIAKHMPKLRRQRNAADYAIDSDFDADAVPGVIELVRQVLRHCDDVERLRDTAAAKESVKATAT